jgi:hypothetical protein
MRSAKKADSQPEFRIEGDDARVLAAAVPVMYL